MTTTNGDSPLSLSLVSSTRSLNRASKFRNRVLFFLPLQIWIISIFLVDLCLAREWLLTSEVYEKTREMRDRGLVWLKTQKSPEFGWNAGDTSRALLAIASAADEDWPLENDLEARLTAKQLEIELLEKLIRHDVTPAGIALYALALNAVCKDPRNFHGHNLIVSLEKHHEDQDYPGYPKSFGFSLTALVSCLSGSHSHKRQIRHLVLVSNDGTSSDSIYTRSMALLALECFRRKRHNEALTQHMGEALKNLALLQHPEGSFGNIFTTTMAIQALSVVRTDDDDDGRMRTMRLTTEEEEVHGDDVHWNRTAAVLALSKWQLADGSFLGSIHATSEAVLASTAILKGFGLLRMKRGRCEDFSVRPRHSQNMNNMINNMNNNYYNYNGNHHHFEPTESSVEFLNTIVLTPSNSDSNLNPNGDKSSRGSSGLSTSMMMTVTSRSADNSDSDTDSDSNSNANFSLEEENGLKIRGQVGERMPGQTVAVGSGSESRSNRNSYVNMNMNTNSSPSPSLSKNNNNNINSNTNNNNNNNNRGPSIPTFVLSTPGESPETWTKENGDSASSSSYSASLLSASSSSSYVTSSSSSQSTTSIIISTPTTTSSSLTPSTSIDNNNDNNSNNNNVIINGGNTNSNSNPNTKETAQIKYFLWIGSEPTSAEKVNITLQVPTNSTFFYVMTKAADQNPQFTFSSTVWPNGHYVHTLSGHREQPIKYQYWLLYKLPVEPDPQSPPPTTYVPELGVDNLQVHDGEIYLYWYKKL